MTKDFEIKTKALIDDLKGVCAAYGLGGDGNEFKIITDVFLYKFMNDKFFYEVKKIDQTYDGKESIEDHLKKMSEEEYEKLLLRLGTNAKLKRNQFIPFLFNASTGEQFAKLFDDTMMDIAATNADIFSVATAEGTKVKLFSKPSLFIIDESRRDDFCRAIINKISYFSFEGVFSEKYDFFAIIFEYMIKDYNKNGGGKYAEYFTPHAVAKIMAQILVEGEVRDVKCYDPAAGSGTLLMSLAHRIGEDKCSIYSQDISQKSSSLLRLNLILNNLAHSLNHIIQGNTLEKPYHKEKGDLMKFEYIVSNPPFKLDFSDYRDNLDATKRNEAFETNAGYQEIKKYAKRFFAGVPTIPKKDVSKMPIYLLFLQHIIMSLKSNGKAAVVVPTGFLTEGKGKQANIAYKIRMKLIDEKMLKAVVSMPSNIFANTGTNVSIIFIDKSNKDSVVFVDASDLGTKIKEDNKNQKTVLSPQEEDRIIKTVQEKSSQDDFSVVKTYDDIIQAGYSFNPGSYFDIKIEYCELTPEEFVEKMDQTKTNLAELFKESNCLEKQIILNFEELKYE
jgi:type I restriction enzyme M protein